MSFAELLDAARALPRDEQLRLASAILDDREASAHDPYTIPEHLKTLLPPPGAVVEVWSPVATTDAAGWEAIQQLLGEIEAGRQKG